MSNFKESQIKGYTIIDGKKVTVLKQGIKKLKRYPDNPSDEEISHINHDLIFLQQYAEYLKKVIGLDDFEVL